MTKKTIKDLMEAARNADYKAIKECLDAGVRSDETDDPFYRVSPMMGLIGTSYYGPIRQDTQTMECIELLFENGADLNHTDSYGNSVMDVLGENLPSPNPKDLYNAAKFILTHGGRAIQNRDYVMRSFDEYCHVMSKEEFEQFEKIGDIYLKAKKYGIELDVEDPKAVEKAVEEMKTREKLESDNLFRRANRSDRFMDGRLRLESEDMISEISLDGIRMARKHLKELNEKLDKREKEILEKLQHGIPERDKKANELKTAMRERDDSGKKMGLRAYLAEKTKEKEVSKNPKTPRRGGNEGM